MVKQARTLLLAALLCGAAAAPAIAALQAQVDQNPVPEDQSFTLTLESDGTDGTPDLSGLARDFDVMGTSKSSSINIVNGAMSRTIDWQISLMPKHSGTLTIPAIAVGGERSAPITVTVTPAGQAQGQTANRQPRAVFLEASAEPHQAYVQQQLHYTVRLYHAVDLANGATLSEPSFTAGQAVVERLGKDRTYETTRNGTQYEVIERDYAIYPQKSGKLVIPPLEFEGDVEQGGSGFFGLDPFNSNTRHLRLKSPAVTLTVKPPPAAFTGNQWVPAQKLQLAETWSQSPTTFTVGQPITRTVTLTAQGLTAAQLPDLTAPVPGLKEYPDRPSLKDQKDEQGITGVRQESIAMIPTRPGTLTLPALEVPWWNTATDRLEVARVPARTITVAPAPGGTAAPPPPPAGAVVAPTSAPAATPHARTAGFWPWLALLNGLGWLVTVLAWVFTARRSRPAPRPRPAAAPSSAKLERALKASCLAGDAAQSKRLLLEWARQTWPQQPPVSLLALARRCEPPLAEALEQLDRALYAPSAEPWHGEALWNAFERDKPGKGPSGRADAAELEPLYPA